MKAKRALELLEVTASTLSLYVKQGKIRAEKLPNGYYDYNDDDIYLWAGHNKRPLRDVAGPDEILEYFTTVMRGEVANSTINDRSKAAVELAKRQIDLVEQMKAQDSAVIVKLDWKRDEDKTLEKIEEDKKLYEEYKHTTDDIAEDSTEDNTEDSTEQDNIQSDIVQSEDNIVEDGE
jgi:DNA-binding transcriptional MerR regulator